MKNRNITVLISVVALFCIPLLGVDHPSEKDSIKRLKSKDPEVRRTAAEDLGRMKSEKAINHLIKKLKDDDTQVRRNAIVALGEIGPAKATKPLLAVLESDAVNRPFTIAALSKIDDPQALAEFEKYLYDSNSHTVVAAAQALGTVGGEEGANVLGKAINQSDDYGCQAIVNVLAKLKNPTTASAIIPLLSQTQIRPKCGPAAAYALGEIGNTEAIKPLVANLDIMESRVQPFAIKALGQLKAKNAVNQIIPFLDHKQASHRLAAIEALTYIGDPQTTPYIQKRLTDPSVPVQKAAKYALKHLEKPKK